MTDQIRPSTSANDTPETPTALLPDPQDSPFFRGGPSPELELPTTEEPPAARSLLTQSQFSRERTKDQEDALASLDETALRPPIEPFDFTPDPQPAEQPKQPTPARRKPWRLAVAAGIAVVLTTAVTAKALSSRQSNVGFFGAQSLSELLSTQVDAPVSHDDESAQPVEEVTQDAPAEEPQEDAWTYEEAPAEEEESTYPDWVYVSPRYDRTYTDNGTSYEDTDEGDSSIEGEPYGLRYDDRGVSYRFDGGGVSYDFDSRNITYDYGYGTVTFDLDSLYSGDGYYSQEDSWDYWDYDTSQRDREHGRGRTYDYGYGHGYIGGW